MGDLFLPTDVIVPGRSLSCVARIAVKKLPLNAAAGGSPGQQRSLGTDAHV